MKHLLTIRAIMFVRNAEEKRAKKELMMKLKNVHPVLLIVVTMRATKIIKKTYVIKLKSVIRVVLLKLINITVIYFGVIFVKQISTLITSVLF
jgi:hypothetical protein